ncbi:hypothetical protein Calhy_1098 [Caldicellulosiruptor hydrothermalis 108]|uniref:MotA/TolQ/ExbB proton channel domain-containing protein n=1 Tax=Caldicellulosiruptor hydrothermalis (strain DSM 18901 / VKM B-2411 / 108) TaxID=632292 RepID=E4Q8H6_CALH1|nr:MotA/TolQ/ExbB proton channel family protein [Caldicellulosiruptor hydrothermalis]ADQ06821.1 hypothetical protein Calhy_1098 [Caldicellulosiruptor hydrothermalis 108]
MDTSQMIFDIILSLFFSISTDTWCFFIIVVATGLFVVSNFIFTYKVESHKWIKVNFVCKKLKEITNKITVNANNAELSLDDVDKIIDSCNEDIIISLWKKYRENSKFSPEEKIDKHFNKANLIDALTNRRLAEATPGLLTGLGILGTFVGLGKGLSDINIATGEAMKSSIENLMIGLKLAFYTSIVGIFFSLVWTLADRILLTSRVRIIHQFQQVIKDIVGEENKSYIKEIHDLLETQTSLLKTIATDISTELSKVLTDKINNEILPQLFSYNDELYKSIIEPAINNIASVIENFSNVASQTQVEGISKIVDKFVNEMSGALSYKFQELAATIDNICTWQLTLKQSLDDFIKSVIETTQNQVKISTVFTDILNSLTSNLKVIEEVNNKASENLDFIVKVQDTFEKQLEMLSIELEKIKEEYYKLVEKIENTDEEISMKISNFLDSVNKVENTIKDISASLTYISDAITASSQDFMQRVNDGLKTGLNYIDSELENITNYLFRLLSSMHDMVEDLDRSLKNFYDSFNKTLVAIETLSKKN